MSETPSFYVDLSLTAWNSLLTVLTNMSKFHSTDTNCFILYQALQMKGKYMCDVGGQEPFANRVRKKRNKKIMECHYLK